MEISFLQQTVGFLAPVGLAGREGDTGGGSEVAATHQQSVLGVARSGTGEVGWETLQTSGIVFYQVRNVQTDGAQLCLVLIKSTR